MKLITSKQVLTKINKRKEAKIKEDQPKLPPLTPGNKSVLELLEIVDDYGETVNNLIAEAIEQRKPAVQLAWLFSKDIEEKDAKEAIIIWLSRAGYKWFVGKEKVPEWDPSRGFKSVPATPERIDCQNIRYGLDRIRTFWKVFAKVYQCKVIIDKEKFDKDISLLKGMRLVKY